MSIIRAGAVVQSGTLAELRQLTRTTVVVQTEKAADELTDQRGVAHITETDGKLSFDVETEHLDEVMRYLAERGIRSLVSHPPTLEELFLSHYGEDVSAAEVGR